MLRFDLVKPQTLSELLEILNTIDCKILSGGTDLLVNIKNAKEMSERLVFIGDIQELKFIKKDKEGLHIGSATTISEIGENSIVKQNCSALYEASRTMANAQVRNLGTVGGNICNASPAGDTIAPLMVYDAQIKIESKGKSRQVSLEKFFTGPGLTVLRPNEVVTEILIPPSTLVSAYERLGNRKAGSIGICGCAVALNIVDDVYKDVKIAFTSVSPTIVRSYELETALTDQKMKSFDLAKYEDILLKSINPITDRRGSKWYRSEVAKVLAKRAIERASNIAKGGI